MSKTRELWPPAQLPMYGPKWKDNGSRCRVRGCRMPRQAVAMVPYSVGEDNGPQGAWRCGNGHSGYLWPVHCDYGVTNE